jgi:hypothetical protein
VTAATGSIRAVVTAIAAPTLGTCPTGRGWRSCTASTGIATRRLKLSSETSTMRRHGVALGCIARRVDGPRQWQAAFWERDPKSVQRHIICRRLDSPDGRNEDGGGGGGHQHERQKGSHLPREAFTHAKSARADLTKSPRLQCRTAVAVAAGTVRCGRACWRRYVAPTAGRCIRPSLMPPLLTIAYHGEM